jgi:hypothetical protein
VLEQQRVLELVRELVLLFYRKQPKQQQRSQLPKRGICSFQCPKGLRKVRKSQLPEIVKRGLRRHIHSL